MTTLPTNVPAHLMTTDVKNDNPSRLMTDLWWFIENVNEDTPERNELFFCLRERFRVVSQTFSSGAFHQDAVVALGFILEGLGTRSRHGDADTLKQATDRWCHHHGAGNLEFTEYLVRFAERASELFVSGYAEHNEECPGVYHYEVSAPFGGWLAAAILANPEPPTDKMCYEVLEEIDRVFWKQLEPKESTQDVESED